MLSPAHIDAVIFDLDDTLRQNHPDANRFFADFLTSQGVPITRQTALKAQRWTHRYWATSEDLLLDIQTFEGYEEPFWENYTRRHLEAMGVEFVRGKVASIKEDEEKNPIVRVEMTETGEIVERDGHPVHP